MYYINTEGKRYPKQIFNRLSEEEQSTFIEIDDETYDSLLKKCDEESKYMIVENGEVVLKDREVEVENPLIAEKRELQSYLDSTDWISAKCYDLGLVVKDVYPLEYNKRVEARTRIDEIKELLGE